MNNFAIEIQGITKTFAEKTVVDNVSLQVQPGSVFGFLGSNGSGKTTTIRMICGLLTPTKGEGQCLGYNIRTQSAEIKMNVGYMPQKFSLYNRLTVQENLQFFATIYQIKNPKEAIATTIDSLSLKPYQHIRAENLSGGWKQRLMLACCILHQPKLLFLDEPTAGVDPLARKEFWSYLHKIAVSNGTTILVTTHYMDEAEKCTNLAYINLGKLLYSGPTEDIIPFSKVKTYQIAVDRKEYTHLNEEIEKKYPEFIVSIVNNNFRVSSSKHDKLNQFIELHQQYIFKEIIPSFEEVFIGLMK